MKIKYIIIALMLATFLVMPGLVRNSKACNHQAITKMNQKAEKKNAIIERNQFDEEIFILNKIYATY